MSSKIILIRASLVNGFVASWADEAVVSGVGGSNGPRSSTGTEQHLPAPFWAQMRRKLLAGGRNPRALGNGCHGY